MSVTELQVEFERRRAEFVDDHEGEWALLFSSGDVEFFADEMAAVNAGFSERAGLEFTVKQVWATERPVRITSVALAEHA